jgi:hypothetical protein
VNGPKEIGNKHGFGSRGRPFNSDQDSLVKAGARVLHAGHPTETLVLYVYVIRCQS